jgi:glycosyltransferase involved in cell wall biosynthesis
MPSRREGLSNVALQAAAGGRALVASRVGSLPEIVSHGDTGALVDLDAESFARAIVALLGDRPALDRMGVAAWERARTCFAYERCIESFAALYGRLARES